MACQNGHAEVVALLLDKAGDTIDVNQASTDGRTPLFAACYDGHVQVVTRLLAQHDIDVDSAATHPSGRQWTPLLAATTEGHAHIADLLRAHQVQPVGLGLG